LITKVKTVLQKNRRTLTALLIRGIVMCLQFIMQIVLVWVAGAMGAGIYALYQAWMAIFSRLTGLGSTTHSLRTVSVLADREEGAAIQSYQNQMSKLLILCGGGLALVYIFASSLLAEKFLGAAELSYVVIAAGIGGVFTNILKIGAESLKGMGRINVGLVLEWAVLPSVVIITAGILAATGGLVKMEIVLYVHVVAILLVAIMLRLIVNSSAEALLARTTSQTSFGLKKLSPLWGGELAVVWFMNIPLLLLPQFVSLVELGVFAIALKLILIVQAVLVVLSSVYGPKFAQKFQKRDFKGLSSDIRETQMISMILYAPMFLLFMFAPEFVMGLFGEEFKVGADLLRILALGQLLYAACGLGDFVLNMAHQEKLYLKINLGCTFLMLVLCWFLSGNLGLIGCAIAVAISIACKQGFAYIATLLFLRRESRVV